MSDVFLSYASSDRERIKPLVTALEQEEFSVWWDRTIPPGKNFAQVIKEELSNAKCVVVVWSRDSVSSEWVETEAALGKRRGILIPALIDDVENDIPLEFMRLEAASLKRWNGDRLDAEWILLLQEISAKVGRSKRPIAPVKPLPKPEPPGSLVKPDRASPRTYNARIIASILITLTIVLVLWGALQFNPFKPIDEGPLIPPPPPMPEYADMHMPAGWWADEKIIAEGKEIFEGVKNIDVNCSSCHGKDGKPVKAGASDFRRTEQMQLFSDSVLYWRISEGVPNTKMKAWKSKLAPEERWKLIAYISTFGLKGLGYDVELKEWVPMFDRGQ